MQTKTVFVSVILAALAMPLSAQAQGIPGGAAHGFHEGGRIAGPVGAVVGTAVGGVIGGIEGVLGVGPTYVAYSEAPRRAHRQRVYRGKAKTKKARRARHARRARY